MSQTKDSARETARTEQQEAAALLTEADGPAEEKAVSEVSRLPSRLLHEVIRLEGEAELLRPVLSLVFSGVAAGILISFSVLGEAIFRTFLPSQPYSHLIENIGYSFGFLLVILGRMQLFTENTITTVLPLMNRPSLKMFGKVARLWMIVLSANVVGAFAAAAMMVHGGAVPDEFVPAVRQLSLHATGAGALDSFLLAIPAGLLVAALVWMMPQAEGAGFFVILLFTWLIGAGDFTHVIAGSVEMAFLVLNLEMTGWEALTSFFLPVLAGNVVGGTAIFTLLAYGQVRDELHPDGGGV